MSIVELANLVKESHRRWHFLWTVAEFGRGHFGVLRVDTVRRLLLHVINMKVLEVVAIMDVRFEIADLDAVGLLVMVELFPEDSVTLFEEVKLIY